MLGKLALLLRRRLALAILGTVLVVAAGTTAVLAASGAPLPLVGQSTQHSGNDANDDHGGSQNVNHNDGQQAEGTIKSINAGQSSFVLTPEHGADVTVVVNGQTIFEEGVKNFASLAVGQHIEVKGTRQADGSLLAAKIEGQNVNDDANDDQNANEREMRGTVSSVNAAGSTFVVKLSDGSTTTVHVSSATAFDGGFSSFADLKVGMAVEVRGNLQADNSVAATRVHREDDGSGDDHSGNTGSGDSSNSGSNSGSGHGGSDDGTPHP